MRPVGREGLRHRRSPLKDAGYLHVEKEGRRAAPLGQLPLALFGNLLRFLTILTPNRERQRAESLFGDFLAALEAVPVVAVLEPRQGVVYLVERFRLHLNQRELDIFLDVGLRTLHRIEDLRLLAAPAPLCAD